VQSLSGSLPIVARASLHGDRTAVVATDGSFGYGDLVTASLAVARRILGHRFDLEEGRVAYLVRPGFQHVAVQWGIWQAGGVAVPLALSHPPPELDFVLADSDPDLVIADPELGPIMSPLARARGIPFRSSSEILRKDERDPAEGDSPPPLPTLQEARRALMIYTSGTTGRPKGVITTHANLRAQVTSLVQAWEWRPEDRILHVLPLHHVHGIVNALTCALWVGATCEIHPRFKAQVVWERLAEGGVTLLMGVPTMYQRLISAWEEAPPDTRRAWSAGARKLRLMVSGSAALPVTTLERWREITGHVLLERYGMTGRIGK
jgi:malonyl-CoA/methylmalonyl-CoA synthetase